MKILPLVSGAALAACVALPARAADPDFGPNVLVFDPSMKDLQSQLDTIAAKQKDAQFGNARYAYLFKPGKYDVNIDIGYYVQVLGLGQTLEGVQITGNVRSNSTLPQNNVTCAFWRSVENFTYTGKNFGWALSQGTDMRHIHACGDVSLSTGGWASGGFTADCQIDGKQDAGTQQQWFTRNSEIGAATGGTWNMVYLGVQYFSKASVPMKGPINTSIEKTPVIAEKPYLYVEGPNYFVRVPGLHKDTAGMNDHPISTGAPPGSDASLASDDEGRAIPIDQFYIAHAGKDTAASINAALNGGKNLLLTPGIYHLEDALHVTKADTVVLGLGYATLIPEKGTPAITVADLDGVKIGGLILQASTINSPTLLQIGDAKSTVSHAANPTIIYDIYARVGGAGPGSTDAMVTINSNDVIGDNAWLWRADHGNGASWDGAKCKNGLVVNGDNVTYYGLAVEHTQEYQTLWNGNGGRVYFYQSEMPYDVPAGVKGWASYKVADGVTTHEAWGVGIYCYFTRSPVVVENDIEAPRAPGVKFHHMVHLKLGAQGAIHHIIDGDGPPAVPDRTPIYLDEWP